MTAYTLYRSHIATIAAKPIDGVGDWALVVDWHKSPHNLTENDAVWAVIKAYGRRIIAQNTKAGFFLPDYGYCQNLAVLNEKFIDTYKGNIRSHIKTFCDYMAYDNRKEDGASAILKGYQDMIAAPDYVELFSNPKIPIDELVWLFNQQKYLEARFLVHKAKENKVKLTKMQQENLQACLDLRWIWKTFDSQELWQEITPHMRKELGRGGLNRYQWQYLKYEQEYNSRG